MADLLDTFCINDRFTEKYRDFENINYENIRPNVENEIKKSKQFIDKVLEKSK